MHCACAAPPRNRKIGRKDLSSVAASTRPNLHAGDHKETAPKQDAETQESSSATRTQCARARNRVKPRDEAKEKAERVPQRSRTCQNEGPMSDEGPACVAPPLRQTRRRPTDRRWMRGPWEHGSAALRPITGLGAWRARPDDRPDPPKPKQRLGESPSLPSGTTMPNCRSWGYALPGALHSLS